MRKTKKWLALSALFLLTVSLLCIFPAAESALPLLAFPEADGMGKYTVGGRGGTVYEVTTLEDGPGIPGSLRAAVEATGPRIVVFKVAGTIALQSNLRVRNPYLTVAGQTAPGEGITLRDYSFSITANEVIVRNIRVRYGENQGGDAMSVSDAENVIIDHCSVSWGVDETLSVTKCDNVTVQWSFVTQGLHNSVHESADHSKGSLVNGSLGQKVTFHHNLYAHHDARSPRPQGRLTPQEDPQGFFFDFTNNVVYDWGRAYAAKNLDEETKCTMNFVNNYFIAGPSSEASNFMLDKNKNSAMYFGGNYMNGKQPSDQYSLIIYEDFKKPDNGWKLDAPFDAQMDTVQSAETAYAMVMKNGGAAMNRDAVDELIVSNVKTGRGRVIDCPADAGGWPELETGAAYIDTDKDGMPDAWEMANGLDPDDAADGKLDADGDGYTNLEEYLNGLMAELYTEDVPFPEFRTQLRWFYHIFYVLFRTAIEVQRFFQSIPEAVSGWFGK